MTKVKIKRVIFISFWTFLSTLWVISGPCWSAEKVFMSYLSRSYQFVPAYIAVSKGFFRQEGIDAVMVQMKAQVSTAALDSGHAQYALAGPSTLNAIVQGAPFRLLAVLSEKTFHFIVARKEIRSLLDLQGRKLGTARVGGADHLAGVEILRSKGVDLRAVQFVSVGGDEPVRTEFLRKGLVDGVIVGPPFPLILKKEGYQVLGGPADAQQGILSGIGTKEDRLKEKRGEVKKVLKALVRGIRFLHERREETITVMVSWLGQSRDLAADSYDIVRPYYSSDGSTSDSNLQFNIDTLKGLIGSTKLIPLSDASDFTILREVQKELGL